MSLSDEAAEMAMPMVIKVGGSWLASPGGVAALCGWLGSPAARCATKRLLIVGGGPMVEGLRQIDRANPFSAQASHWAAIDAMDTNTRLLASRLPDWRYTESFETVRQNMAGDWLMATGYFLRTAEPAAPGERLEASWDVTSDSIAARIAALLPGRLVLLKAVSPPAGCRSLKDLSALGYVDPSIDRILPRGTPVRCLGVAEAGLAPDPAGNQSECS
ncbi:amino acid kinase family protein [Botrimarina hoheduenensis]|uniref:Aspartate/glutamate/uridylate kinase domain-containing protein n=1 Tax=Botrimarina hoheduenensis TaxID=2528000 RepID=A0A5C5VVX8_9BACT|nr:hypothetical protein [Botrimarina hoheduenensis]TWT42758.1 hypothetical protein Pla111_27310 [Botrimarina hoheduenensis]